MNSWEPFSAISDSHLGLEARIHSPLNKNTSWTPSLSNTTKLVSHLRKDELYSPLYAIHESVVADDKIVPLLPSDLDKEYQSSLHHDKGFGDGSEIARTFVEAVKSGDGRIHAQRGIELLKELGFQENDGNEVLWL